MAGRRRFSIANKILFIAGSFALPIAVLTYFVVATIQQDIDFAALELKGDVYQRPLEAILQGVKDYALLAATCASQAECGKALAPVRAGIDGSFTRLSAIDQQIGPDLLFTDQGLAQRGRQAAKESLVAAEWTALANATETAAGRGATSPELTQKYDHLADDLRLMITHAGDKSNLILDPQIDSYYLVDVTLLALPQTQDRLGRVIRLGHAVLAKAGPAKADQVQLALDAANLQDADYQRVSDSLGTSLSENALADVSASYQRLVPPAEREYKAATAPFIAMVKQLAITDRPQVTANQFVTAGILARAASFKLWSIADRELDGLLLMRIESRKQARAWALILSALAMIISSGLAYMMMRSITGPLDRLARSLGPGATLLGESVNRIALASSQKSASPEESAIICEELTAHADNMRSAVGELVSLISGGKNAGFADIASVSGSQASHEMRPAA